jgi:citrate synthase
MAIALECEHIAPQDDYFVSRRLYPNVDLYTGLIYQSMGSCSRCSLPSRAPRGWIA